MPVRPISLPALIEQIADLVVARPGWVRIAVDGADALEPDAFADALAEPVRVRGRPTVRVRAADHLRPASLRWERGRDDPDSFYEDWLDCEGLRREVFEPLELGRSGRIRPVRWDAESDRARREGFVEVAPGAVLILSGPLLLGRDLPLDLSVHLDAPAAALRRRTRTDLVWTLAAYERYAAEVAPAAWADVVVRLNDPHHPALARFPGDS